LLGGYNPKSDSYLQEITTFWDAFALLQWQGSLDRRRILSRKDPMTNQAIRPRFAGASRGERLDGPKR